MGSNNPSKQYNGPMIHLFSSLVNQIQVLVLPLRGHKAIKANQTKSQGKKMRENGKLQVDQPRNRSSMFPKSMNRIV